MTLEEFHRLFGRLYFLVVLLNSCLAQQTQTSQDVVINTDGSYHFSYDTGTGLHKSFRTETRSPTGEISGSYGYVDPDGKLRITEYTADSNGYRSEAAVFHPVHQPPNNVLVIGPLPQKSVDEDSSTFTSPVTSIQPPKQPSSRPTVEFMFPEGELEPIDPNLLLPPDPLILIGPIPKHLQNKQRHRKSQPNEFRETEPLGSLLTSTSTSSKDHSVISDRNDDPLRETMSFRTEPLNVPLFDSSHLPRKKFSDHGGFGLTLPSPATTQTPQTPIRTVTVLGHSSQQPGRQFRHSNDLVPDNNKDNEVIPDEMNPGHLLKYLLPSLK